MPCLILRAPILRQVSLIRHRPVKLPTARQPARHRRLVLRRPPLRRRRVPTRPITFLTQSNRCSICSPKSPPRGNGRASRTKAELIPETIFCGDGAGQADAARNRTQISRASRNLEAVRTRRALPAGLSLTAEERVVRVRIAGALAFLTVKGPAHGITRLELEYPIPMADAAMMLDLLCERPLIEKTKISPIVCRKNMGDRCLSRRQYRPRRCRGGSRKQIRADRAAALARA